MNFMEYSNKTQSNIIPKEEFQNLICEVFEVIAENMAKSLGPLGSSATILDGMMTEATKDGHSIFKSYRFHNRYKKMIYNLIKAPCNRLNSTVGDGTTTAIVFASYLFRFYKARKNELETLYRLPRTFVQVWDEMIDELIEEIIKSSNSLDALDSDAIYNICYVTSNGNHEISQNIANIYKETKSPVIKQKNSPTNKSYIKPVVGFEFPANLIDSAYVRSEDLSVEEKNIQVMIFDHKIETDFCQKIIIPINDILKAQGKKLLILAPFYDAYLCETILKQYVNYEYQKYKSLNLIIAQYTIGKLDPHQLSDLATVLRTFVITQDLSTGIFEEFTSDGSKDSFIEKVTEDPEHKFYGMIGVSASAMMSCTDGSIFRVKDIESDQRYSDVLRSAKKELADIIATTDNEKQSYASKIYDANARISQLEMQNYIYYVGANSELQKKITWDSVEDVIKCVRSAIKHGTVPGCQLSIMKGCQNILDKYTYDSGSLEDINNLPENFKLRRSIVGIIKDAAKAVYSTVIHGPEGMGIAKTIPMWQHIAATDEGIVELGNAARQEGERIIHESVSRNQVFDLETLGFNEKIITSAETDRMVLIAASELVKILISGNQCIFLDSDVNESHNEIVEINA
jgi:chaperonin GroEL (HSP60 family)